MATVSMTTPVDIVSLYTQTCTETHTNSHTETHFFMLKKDHQRRGVPSPGSPAQCVPVHFHHVVPAEHGVAFSPALWDTSLPFLWPHVCVCACVSCLPSFRQRELPVPGPPAWIGHRAPLWPSWINTNQGLYQNPTNATPQSTSVGQRRPAKRTATVPISSSTFFSFLLFL